MSSQDAVATTVTVFLKKEDFDTLTLGEIDQIVQEIRKSYMTLEVRIDIDTVRKIFTFVVKSVKTSDRDLINIIHSITGFVPYPITYYTKLAQ